MCDVGKTCVSKIHLAPTRDVQNNNTSHYLQFEMMYFNLLSHVHYLIPRKVKLQEVKLFYYCIAASSSEKTNLHLRLHITKYYYLPGKLNLQQNCLLVVMVPIMCVLHLPTDKLSQYCTLSYHHSIIVY